MQEMNRTTQYFTDSVIRHMSQISLSCGAVNLAQGFPEFDPPKALTDRLAEVSARGPHQYPPSMGMLNFRHALAKKCGRFMGRELDPETEVIATIGSTEALVAALFTVTNPGDRVILFSPYFENYCAQVRFAGCEPVFVALTPPHYGFDANLLEDRFREGAKAILICNPSNPSGKVFTPAELTQIADLAKRYDAYVIMDEVYEHIVYAPHVHTYMNSLPGMWERTISCGSLSKTYSITGWRLGYAITSRRIMDKLKQFHHYITVGASSPLMEAAIAGLELPDSYYTEFTAYYARLRQIFTGGLKRIGITYTEPQGTYFVLADIQPFLKKGQTDLEFCEEMARKVGVAAVPGTSFFEEDVGTIIRMHFAKKEDSLYEALNRLSDIKAKMA